MDRYGPPPRRALVVTAAMGSGHVQVGKELARRLEGLGHRVRIVELTDVMAGPTGDWLAAMYPWLVQRPAVYDWVYRTFLHARQERGRRIGIPARLAERGLQAVCDAWHPDVVVTTFHVAGQALGRLRGDGRITAPVVTFVTTFGVHDGWLHPATDAYLCISPLVAAELRQRTAAPVRCPGPVVRPEFDPRLGARGIVGAARDGGGEQVALLVAGSLGMGDVGRTARVVAGTAGWRPVVACGGNDQLLAQLRAAGVGEAHGWVDDMASLMRRADVLVDNAAGLTAKEALGLGLPVVVFRPLAGHGRHDAAAMAALGVTEVVDRDEYLAPVLARAAEPTALRRDRIERGRALFVEEPAVALLELLGAGRPQGSLLAAGR